MKALLLLQAADFMQDDVCAHEMVAALAADLLILREADTKLPELAHEMRPAVMQVRPSHTSRWITYCRVPHILCTWLLQPTMSVLDDGKP